MRITKSGAIKTGALAAGLALYFAATSNETIKDARDAGFDAINGFVCQADIFSDTPTCQALSEDTPGLAK